MRRSLTLLAVAAVAVVPFAASAQVFIGPQAGVYLPNSSFLRDKLGDSWFSFGAGRMNVQQAKERKFGSDFNIISKRANGNALFMASATYGVVMPFGDGEGNIRPYGAIRGGLSYIDYAITDGLVRRGGKKVGYNFNAEVGVIFNNRLALSARYDFFSEHEGINFNGLSINLKYGLVQF